MDTHEIEALRKQNADLLLALRDMIAHAESLIEEEYPRSMHAEQFARFDYAREAVAAAEAMISSGHHA